MMLQPTSSGFRQLCGAAIAYGLTSGGYNAQQIAIEETGRRIVRPRDEGDDLAAKREAILKPRVVREFLEKYNGSGLPRQDIAINVLEAMKVPRARAESAYEMILENAQSVGLLREIKGRQYVDLDSVELPSSPKLAVTEEFVAGAHDELECVEIAAPSTAESPVAMLEVNRRVFVTHGQNREFIEPIKKLLGFGELLPVVSVERQSVSQPVPDKVLNDMRSCGAAIIHVDADEVLIDKDANARAVVNPNVLIEIGAAMALYGRRFILLVKDGVNLPSNLQGLYEVRYKGELLDGETTIRLLEAINDIKNNALPERGVS